MSVTAEDKQLIVQQYQEAMAAFATDEERAANSVSVVNDLAESFEGATPNGIRVILGREKVYVKAPPAKPKKESTAAPRANKAEAIQALRDVITDINPELVDSAIIDKLTGKAAAYFTSVIVEAVGEQ